ncbi:FHA domain-containing protein [Streptomyces sp. NPDC005931]|uniref:FHA domain-containing protein n=1 Tax=Streptomyces sp. NPDC005931 TaxID=3364737 RepID=UPI00368D0E44
MQIRLTVVDPLGPSSPARDRAASCDVLVTAPAGTALAAVASALASAVSGADGASGTSGTPVLYAGDQRLDAQRCTLGEPPLIDGSVLYVGAPGEPEPHPELDEAPTRLHVVAGPDAGGVHLLHGGEIRIGRSADADVPLDDPDVSRIHCAVTVGPDGRVAVADLGSTNGTTLDGRPVGPGPVRFAPGALLRIGESALRLTPAEGPGARARTTPDGEGHVRVPAPQRGEDTDGPAHPRATATPDAVPDGATHHGHGSAGWATRGTSPNGAGPGEPPTVPRQGGAPGVGTRGPDGVPPGADGPSARSSARADEPRMPGGRRVSRPGPAGADPHPAHTGDAPLPAGAAEAPPDGLPHTEGTAHFPAFLAEPAEGTSATTRRGTPLRGTDLPQPPGGRRRGGLTAWARRLAGGRQEPEAVRPDGTGEPAAGAAPEPPVLAPGLPETWPDPAALLLTALGPGPRLWERGPGHPEALAVRLGTADRAAPDGSGLLPAVPVTSGLREVGALGLAGPRERLAGLTRAVLAQLAALHSPDSLEIVLIAADRSRPLEERSAEWSWLGWLPHVRPGHGQDCRLLLAHDREQATARVDELLRRLDDHEHGTRHPRTSPAGGFPQQATGTVLGRANGLVTRQPTGRAAGGTAGAAPREVGGPVPGDAAGRAPSGSVPRRAPDPGSPARRPSWARADDDGPDGADGFTGPYAVVVVDGDPGGTDLREAVARLAVEGPRAGIHVVCLAETAAASPASPVTETYEAACAVAPPFRACGAVALLSGDVATALRLVRVAPAGSGTAPGPVGHGTVATVDAVSRAWAERFARALAPLRTDGPAGERHARVSAPLPQSARLLDELGLARATPASLMARWADAADDTEALGGRVTAVLGAGPRGPVVADLAADGPHLLVEGPPGSGRTELLRAVVASLAAAERPDRLAVVLVDGRGGTSPGPGHGDGLRVCTDVPHVTTHLGANDPVRMREFAQSLSAELKRRAELLGRSDFAEWHTGRELSDRMIAQRTAASRPAPGTGDHDGDLESPPSSTLRLRPGAARRKTEAAPPLPRLVVVVDDLDALVSPALGSPGRPAAGSVMRALEAVARDGARLGVHLVTATGPCARTAETEPVRRASLRVALDAPAAGPDEPAPGRGRLMQRGGRVTPVQGGRVTGRIPRTATLRPTVVPLEWHRMGDPPTRRPVRELGNGPTDLALLASALERAAREVSAAKVPSLL